ncbi:hypothetical protein JR316_0010196 [Psilocybe cubensis]|uniref:Uncharacterized protein n=1 Tax=Psilocybe cubensis TaxID=181762 RepID=A0ACB8GQE9_PSICU|nr:hypothetical protein JR316_0010196 [Psilocybe cubensis]KAH9477963.1 hypothetical protein JR316_0010196 [Psilocybe cubensis]
MIVPENNMNDAGSSSQLYDHTSQRPPSYRVEDIRSFEPVDKVPVFPTIPELDVDSSASSSTTPSSNTAFQTPYTISPVSPSGSHQASSSKGTLTTSLFSDTELPTAFSRVPPAHISYESFKPLFLAANGKTLEKGFPPVPPPSVIHPHPFTYHDVTESDWLSFLEALRAAASLTEKDINRSFSVPIISSLPLVGQLTGAGVQMLMKGRKGNKVAKVVDRWNHHFFCPRRMRAVLMKGSTKISGITEIAADGQLSTYPEYQTPTTPNDDVFRLFVISV